jgi:UDP-N-acetylglucosamine 1-carboxyvinyltransferase
VDDLLAFLQKMGAAVERTGPDTIVAEGRRRLRGAEHRVVADRIEAGTFAVAAAVAGGRVTLEGAPCEYLGSFVDVLGRMGVQIACSGETIEVEGLPPEAGAYRAVDVETAPYPGFATDLQSPASVLMTRCAGTSRLHETIYEDRLEWLTELRKMGAVIDLLDPHHAHITGPARLRAAEVEIGDLRAGASLILGALAAEGISTIHGAHHVQRGYENIDRKFHDLGARIERLPEQMGGTSL